MWHMTSPILIDIPEEVIGFRVLLRPYRPEDAAALWEAIQESREHLAPWMPWVHDYHSLDVARAYVARARARWLPPEPRGDDVLLCPGRGFVEVSLARLGWTLRTFEI